MEAGKGTRSGNPLGQLVALFLPLLVVGLVTALGLRILGIIPSYFKEEPPGFQPYATVQEAERALGWKSALPSYFPDFLAWPPSEIQAQRKPFPAIYLAFDFQQGGKALSLYQGVWRGDVSLPGLPPAETATRRSTLVLEGRELEEWVGESPVGAPYLLFRWQKGDRGFIALTSLLSGEDFLKIVRSLLH